MEQDFLMFTRFGDAPPANFDSVARRQHDVHHAEFFQFIQHASGFVAEARVAAQLSECLLLHIGKKAHQNQIGRGSDHFFDFDPLRLAKQLLPRRRRCVISGLLPGRS